LPRKALHQLNGLRTPSTPIKNAAHNLHTERPFWYDDCEASNSKSDTKLLPEWTPAFLSPTVSNASTSAGPSAYTDVTASPFDNSPPPGNFEAEVQSYRQPQPSGWLQTRKVFVGGIPQSVDQKDLHKLFSVVSKVKMAWLQMHHHDHHDNRAPGVRKHRGFGFVVFAEKNAVDQLLGMEYSQFVDFGNFRFEVKRAVGKEDYVSGTPDVIRDEGMAPVTSGDHRASPSAAGSSHGHRNISTPASPISAPFDAYTNFPSVPPFPSSWSSGAPEPQRGAASVAGPVAPSSPQPSWSYELPAPHRNADSRPDATVAPYSMYTSLYDTLLDGFVGQKPRNTMELEYELLRATPDRYDD